MIHSPVKLLLLSLCSLVTLTTGSSYGTVQEFFPENSINARIECTPADLVGALVCPLLDQAILLDTIPLLPELNIANLTEFLATILPNSSLSTMIEGRLELRNVSVIDLRNTDIRTCDFGSGTQMNVDFAGTFPNLTVEAAYTIDATVGSDMTPVTGQGRLSLSLDLILAVLTEVKYCPTDEHMAVNSFNYSLSLPTPFLFSMDGLEGEAAVVEDLLHQIVDLLEQLRLDILELDQVGHDNIANLLMAVLNGIVLQNLIPCDVPLLQIVLGGCDV